MIFFGEASLKHTVKEYMTHYHTERNHQGIENRLINATPLAPASRQPVRRRERLGGMLNYYYRATA